MSNNINLNFINKSSDTNNSSVVIFQHNTTPSYNELAIAWRVIKNVGSKSYHPFPYPLDFSINTTDAPGNNTPMMHANHGQHWEVVNVDGDQNSHLLRLKGKHSNPEELVIANNLQRGAIDANIYKDGKLLATIPQVSSQDYAKCSFGTTIHIAIAEEAVEGEPVKKYIEEGTDTELSLEGISSADIVMTGTAPQYTFTLENVKKA